METDQNFSSAKSNQQPVVQDPDEINLLEYIYVVVRHKWLIIGMTLLGLVLGVVVARLQKAEFATEIVIAPQEAEGSKTPSLAGLGALGGIVASQFSFSGNASLEKITTIVESRKFNAEMIDKYDLIPVLYRYSNPKYYHKMYDTVTGAWKKGFVRPDLLGMGGGMKGYLKKEINKNNTMTLTVASKDSLFSAVLITCYVEYLDYYFKATTLNDAQENIDYLQNRLEGIADPFLRDKIQQLIANEEEKRMFVSKKAFKIVDPLYSYSEVKSRQIYPIVGGVGLFFISLIFIMLQYVFVSSTRTHEDQRLIQLIKKELGRIR